MLESTCRIHLRGFSLRLRKTFHELKDVRAHAIIIAVATVTVEKIVWNLVEVRIAAAMAV